MKEEAVTFRILESGVDYVTFTYKTADSRKLCSDLSWGLRTRESQRGCKETGINIHGYQGYRVGGITWARRMDSDLVQLSSGIAAEYWLAFGAAAQNCTRVDLQVTVQASRADPAYASRLFQRLTQGAGEFDKVPNVRIIESALGGATLYFGSRQSERFGRLYDKGAESKDPKYARSWRYEVEYKGEVARKIWEQLMFHETPERDAISTVHDFYEKRGLTLPWSPDGHSLNSKVPLRQSDTEAKLGWLVGQVKPTIKWLETRVTRAELLAALGIDDA